MRLTNRVKKSPALANNALELKKKRKHSLQRAKDQMKYLENVYNQQKAMMDLNVANRPLLVEQQTQEFINLYNQIRDLQKYVAILRNANLNPNDHLTEDQKILLQRAQYFDQLNGLAYFPDGVTPAGLGEQDGSVLDEAQQQQLLMLQQQQNQAQYMPVDQQNYQPDQYYEQVNQMGQMHGAVQQPGAEMADGDPGAAMMGMQAPEGEGMEEDYGEEDEVEMNGEEEGAEAYGEEEMQEGEGEEEMEMADPHGHYAHPDMGPQVVNELQAHMDMDEGEDVEGEEQYQNEIDIDRQGEQQILDDEEAMGEEMEGDEEEMEENEQMRMQMHEEGGTPDHGESNAEYGEGDDAIEEADHQVRQLMNNQRQHYEDEDEMEGHAEGEEEEDDGEEDMYELDEEQY